MRNTLLLGMVTFMLASCATTSSMSNKGAIQVIAHRGASAYAPENTLAAFGLAADMKADWFELDVHLSKDGAPVVMHDDSVDRTTGVKGTIASMTLARLKELDAGAWKAPKFAGERIPTLEEALTLAKKRKIGVYVEIKNASDDTELMDRAMSLYTDERPILPAKKREFMKLVEKSGTRNLELTRRTIQTIRALRMSRRIVIQSFSPIACAIAKAEAPNLRVEFLGSKDKKKPENWDKYLRWADALNLDGHNLSKDTITPELIARFQRGDKTMAVWTVDEEADMKRFADWRVNAIITNRPDVCLNTLQAMRKR